MDEAEPPAGDPEVADFGAPTGPPAIGPSLDADVAFLRLQPLTVDFLATQLERLGVTFQRQSDRLVARWPSFTLVLRVTDGAMLGARATLRRTFSANDVTSLTGQCNWWNSNRYFVKASTRVEGSEQPLPGDERVEATALAFVDLDHDAPFLAGVAPVQIQALVRQVVSNVADFEKKVPLTVGTS